MAESVSIPSLGKVWKDRRTLATDTNLYSLCLCRLKSQPPRRSQICTNHFLNHDPNVSGARVAHRVKVDNGTVRVERRETLFHDFNQVDVPLEYSKRFLVGQQRMDCEGLRPMRMTERQHRYRIGLSLPHQDGFGRV